MNEISTSGYREAGWYEIGLKGHLDSRWTAWFDGLNFSNEIDGTATISRPVVYQAALHDLLQKVRDIGVSLISVIQVGDEQPDLPTITPR
jgi:hypothetical protein